VDDVLSTKTGRTKPRAPQGLTPNARAIWTRLQREYQIIDAAGLAVLEQAVRSYERAEEARRQLAKGSCVRDRWGQPKPHPAAAIERDARAGFLAALRQLAIEIPSGAGD